MTWTTDLLADGPRPFDAAVSVANVTGRAMVVRARLTFSSGRTRTQAATIAPGRTWSATVRALFGSQIAVPDNTLTSLTVTCDGGATACPVLWTRLMSPGCVGTP